MIKDIFKHVKKVLEQNDKFCENGKLFKNIVNEAALKLDKELLNLLLSDNRTKEIFFETVNKIVVFDKIKFQRFISNKNFLADSYTAYKNKIGLAVGNEYFSANKNVVLNFPHKECVLVGGMTKEDEKERNEVFFNETLSPDEITRLKEPKLLTNFKRINKDGEHAVKEITTKDNLIIKGNNLLALHSLKKVYAGKVKLIYIDPPYNTGGDNNIFTYNNTFNHSTWLTFMKNRLEVAKELLRDDGFIAIAIDHYELGYLISIADEIYGQENRIGIISVVNNPMGRNQAKYFSTVNDFMLIYSKNTKFATFNSVVLDDEFLKTFDKEDENGKYKLKNFIRIGGGDANLAKNKQSFWYPLYVSQNLKEITLNKKEKYIPVYPITPSGQKRTWKLSIKSAENKLDDLIAARDEQGTITISEKYRLEKGQKVPTVWSDKKYNANHNGIRLLEKIIERKDFSFPKSIYTVLDTLKIMTKKDDIVLDFFAGSGTTGHAVLELNRKDGGNRKFILVEQLEEHIEICKERNQKVIQNHIKEKVDKQSDLINEEKNKALKDLKKEDFVYFELKEQNQKIAEDIKNSDYKNLPKIWKEVKENPYISYKADFRKTNDKDLKKQSLKDQQKILYDILDKNMLYIPYSERDNKDFDISKEEKRFSEMFYREENKK